MSLRTWYPLVDGSLENKGLDTTPLTMHGTVPFADGRVRTAPRFNGVIGNSLIRPNFLTKDNSFSVSLWIKRADTASAYVLYHFNTGIANEFTVFNGVNLIFRYVNNLFNFGNLDINTWHHLAVTVDENKIVRGYTDGVLAFTSTHAITFTPNDRNFSIGGVSTFYFNGQLQDFRYYDHCLSPKEVKEIAKGLCLHLPLKGTNARPNLFKNSATMFNRIGGIPIATTCTLNPVYVLDENAPCGMNGKILRATVNRPDNSVNPVGGYYWRESLTSIPTLIVGQKYCVSVWVRCTANNIVFNTGGFMEGHTIVKGSGNRTLTSEWKRYYAIFIATKETSTTCFYIIAPIGASGILEYCCPKLELLSPTPYIPNVDDTQYFDYVLDYEPDCSGNEFDATKHGDLITSDSNGRYNTAVAFNGTNTYLQGLAPTNSECKEFTIATWIKMKEVSTNQTIYTCRTVIGSGLVLFYLGAGGGIRLDDGTTNVIFANSTLEPNKWYHIAVTRDTTARKLYINGEFVSSATTTGALSDMGTMYQVGESNAQTTTPIGNYLYGSLSDLRLYTSVLSADDVKELYETSASIDRDNNFYTYEYDEGLQASITKTGIANFTDLKEVNNTMSIEQNLTKVNNLIEK